MRDYVANFVKLADSFPGPIVLIILRAELSRHIHYLVKCLSVGIFTIDDAVIFKHLF